MLQALNKVKFGEHEKQSIEATAKQAIAAIKDFANWLKAAKHGALGSRAASVVRRN